VCGIAGFVGNGGAADLRRMTGALSHRGPDAEGNWSDVQEAVFLGHRRLSIIDIEGGSQPMWTADGRTGIVFNGEIYNFLELRHELKAAGHRFTTDHSDTEVILHGYREWGVNVVKHMNGMWSFVLIDRDRRLLFCSRDRFGKKPFYYVQRPGLFAFASEISALAKHPEIRFSVSRLALKKYFGYGFIPAPSTLFTGVHKLPGGCSLILDLRDQASRIERYWEFLLEPDEVRPEGYEQACAEEVLSLLDNAVKRRLVSDVPIGIFLSGGIDSSAIAALAARHVPRGSLKTFSIAFKEGGYDESQYAARIASDIASDHRSDVLSADKAIDLLPEIFSRLDEPLGDSSLLPTYLLCKHTRQHVTVALGGDGSDELFAGYAPFKALRWARLYSRTVCRPVHKAILAVASRLPVSHGYMSFDLKVKRTLRGLSYSPELWNPLWMSSLSEPELSDLFGEPVDLESIFSEAIDAWDRDPTANDIDRTLQFFTRLYLQDDILTKVDRASMLVSLEARAPFLDIELVDRVRKLPSDLKLRGGTTKYILRKALRDTLPAEVLTRTKQGFAVPIASWFASRKMTLDVDSAEAIVNRDFTRTKLHQHIGGEADHRWFLWNQWALSAVGAHYPTRAHD